MSKSIYEEALETIDNIYESDTIEGFAYYVVKKLPLSWEVNRDALEKMKHALEQAQKQEKLLGQYMKTMKLYKELEVGFSKMQEKFNEINRLTVRRESDISCEYCGGDTYYNNIGYDPYCPLCDCYTEMK